MGSRVVTPTRLIGTTDRLWTSQQITEAFPQKPNGGGEHASGTEPEADIGLLAAALAATPNKDVDWASWNAKGMAIWRATAAKGFDLFDMWSQRSAAKYDARRTLKKWNEFFRYPPTKLGAGSIFREADLASPGWRKAHEDKFDAPHTARGAKLAEGLLAGRCPRRRAGGTANDCK